MQETNKKETQNEGQRNVYYKRSDLTKKQKMENLKNQEEYKKKIIRELNNQNFFNDSAEAKAAKNAANETLKDKNPNNNKANNSTGTANKTANMRNRHTNGALRKHSSKTNNTNGFNIIFLGGLGEVGKNIIGVEFDNEIIIIDAGSAFPSDDLPGIDLIVPDIDYLIRNKNKVKGIVITHGHEDHIGALPHVLNYIDVPIYGSKMTHALIQRKLSEKASRKISPELITVKDGDTAKISKNFSVEFIHVNHSIAGAFSLGIHTPIGTWVHTGDFKIDYTPIDNKVTDLQRFAELGKKGVLLLTSDSTNAEREGSTISEKTVGKTIEGIVDQYKDKRIIASTFASNIYRIQLLVDIAKKQKRKIVFSGRSMLAVTEIAAKIGELEIDKDVIIPAGKLNKYKNSEIMIISTGSQGEEFSALTRIAKNEFKGIKLGEDDVVILSASPIPGNEKPIGEVINNLYRCGAHVIYDKLAEVHVSGHAKKEELKIMHALLKPKFFMPVHGEFRMLKAHVDLAVSMGMPSRRMLIPEIGNVIEIKQNDIKLIKNVQAGGVFVDGFGYGDSESDALLQRKQMAEDGVCVVMLGVNRATGNLEFGPEIIAKGFIYSSDNDALLEGAKKNVLSSIEGMHLSVKERSIAKDAIKKSLTNYFVNKAKRRPMILPFILEN